MEYFYKSIFFSIFYHRFIFPGLALGAALGQTGVVTNAMINASAEVCLLFFTVCLHIFFQKNIFLRQIVGFSRNDQ